MEPDQIKRQIEDGLSGSEVMVSGDGRHFEAVVVNERFSGKSTLEQHRMVYGALGESFASEALHALSLKTYTPEQWRGEKA